MYLRCSALIQKQRSGNILFFVVGINFSVLMFQIFTAYSLLKLKACPWWLGRTVKACASQAQGPEFKPWCSYVVFDNLMQY